MEVSQVNACLMCKNESVLPCEHTFLCLCKIAEKLLVIAEKGLLGLSSHRPNVILPMSVLSVLSVCGNADAALQLDYQSLSSMHQWCASQTGRKKHFKNFTSIDRFSTRLAGQSACHFAVCHKPS